NKYCTLDARCETIYPDNQRLDSQLADRTRKQSTKIAKNPKRHRSARTAGIAPENAGFDSRKS
ncbi:MAG: hypothetical protein VZR53_17180, partial [Prevotella sp.]|nr:hypothetical protein [Prevotella sp.]